MRSASGGSSGPTPTAGIAGTKSCPQRKQCGIGFVLSIESRIIVGKRLKEQTKPCLTRMTMGAMQCVKHFEITQNMVGKRCRRIDMKRVTHTKTEPGSE
jgi:hypothetical protein